MMVFRSTEQFKVMLDLCEKDHPELYLKLLGKDDDLSEFHHELWKLPFYQKMVVSSKGFNTTKYLYISDKNCSSAFLFFIYELTYTKLSLKGTHNIEKKIIDIVEEPEKFRESLDTIFSNGLADDVPPAIWNYTILL